mmetsp:Transcript_922/g.1047  ORF Transcript_922/g.1047 Transcript_922/m.1047 type:complete len:80 (+) Transcript_922:298-537(+)
MYQKTVKTLLLRTLHDHLLVVVQASQSAITVENLVTFPRIARTKILVQNATTVETMATFQDTVTVHQQTGSLTSRIISC